MCRGRTLQPVILHSQVRPWPVTVLQDQLRWLGVPERVQYKRTVMVDRYLETGEHSTEITGRRY